MKNKKGQLQYIPIIIIILIALYLINQVFMARIAIININNIEGGICDNLNLTIEKGAVVKWVNNGNQQVQLDLSSITTPQTKLYLPPGATYSLKFDTLGTYSYTCVNDIAQIIVK